ALQLIKQKYFDGKNLFTAMKDAISEEGVYLINLDDDDLRNIRTSTREMQRSRTLIANDWGEFLKPLAVTSLPSRRVKSGLSASVEAEVGQKTIPVDLVEYSHFFYKGSKTSNPETLRDLSIHHINDLIGGMLKPGEVTVITSESSKTPLLYVAKATDGTVLLNGARVESLKFSGRIVNVPRSFPEDQLSRYRIVDLPTKISEAYTEVVRNFENSAEVLTEKFKASGANMQFFRELQGIAEANYRILNGVHMPLKWNGTVYHISYLIIGTKQGIRVNLVRADRYQDPPSELLAHLANFTVDKKYPDIVAFGKELLDFPETNISSS
ncbi:MAG: hypothetical protein AAB592_01650, partial [Patescibacteria group bacterium]